MALWMTRTLGPRDLGPSREVGAGVGSLMREANASSCLPPLKGRFGEFEPVARPEPTSSGLPRVAHKDPTQISPHSDTALPAAQGWS